MSDTSWKGEPVETMHRDVLIEILRQQHFRLEALEVVLNQTSDLAQSLCVACRSQVPDKRFLNWAHDEIGVKLLDICNAARAPEGK